MAPSVFLYFLVATGNQAQARNWPTKQLLNNKNDVARVIARLNYSRSAANLHGQAVAVGSCDGGAFGNRQAGQLAGDGDGPGGTIGERDDPAVFDSRPRSIGDLAPLFLLHNEHFPRGLVDSVGAGVTDDEIIAAEAVSTLVGIHGHRMNR